MKKLIFFILLLILSSGNLLSQSGWFWQNPLPQGNDLNDVSFINSNTGWIVGNLGTILKTTDAGLTFIKFEQDVSRNNLNVKFFNNNTGYIAGRNLLPGGAISDGHFILKTTNGGLNWYQVSANNIDLFRNLIFIDENTGWFLKSTRNTSFSKLYKTSNGGSTWDSTILLGYSVTVFFLNDKFGWIGSSLRTTNGGLNWISNSNVFEANSLYFVDSTTGYATGTFGGINKTTNGGINWNYISPTSYSSFESLFFVNANTGIAVGFRRTSVRTTNGGTNWQIIETDETPPTLFSYNNTLNKITYTDQVSYIVGESGIIKKSTSGLFGEKWETITKHTGISLNYINFINANTGFISGINPYSYKYNYVIKTTNAGSTWNEAFDNPDTTCTNAYFINENEGWIGGGGNLYRTTDLGNTWHVKFNVHHPYKLINPYFLNTMTGFITKQFTTYQNISSAELYKTTDSGENWINTSLFCRSIVKIKFNDFNIGWCLGATGSSQYSRHSLFRTSNGGINWFEVDKPNNTRLIQGFENINIDYAWCSANDTLYKTTNGGLNWSYVFNDVDLEFIQFLNINTGFVASSGKNFYKTTDGGISWGLSSLSRFQIQKNDLFFINENTGWFIGNNGKILKTIDGGGVVGVNYIALQVPLFFSLHQNYPNPFNPVTKIKFDIPQNHLPLQGGDRVGVLLKIFDMLGREVAILVNEQLQPGSYSIDWDGTGFASGVYFYSLVTEKFTETKRMVLVK